MRDGELEILLHARDWGFTNTNDIHMRRWRFNKNATRLNDLYHHMEEYINGLGNRKLERDVDDDITYQQLDNTSLSKFTRFCKAKD